MDGFYLIAIGQTEAKTEVKCALLMGEAEEDALAVYNSFKAKLLIMKKDKDGKDVIEKDFTNDFDKVVEQIDLHAAENRVQGAVQCPPPETG